MTEVSPWAGRHASTRVREVADGLRTGLLPLLRESAGPRVRPSRLVTRLGLDKSLASRLTRSLSADSPLELLHLIPSPTGLGILLDAAAESGVGDDVLDPARNAVAEFQRLIDAHPGGRSSLDALLADSAAAVRKRTERSASQSVVRGMSQVLGFHCDSITTALILHPADREDRVDGIEVGLRCGVRRLRPSAPVALFSVNMADARTGPWLEPLGPDADATDPMSYLLPRFSSPQSPSVELHRAGDHVMFALPGAVDPVEPAVTVASAYRIRHGWVPYRTPEETWALRVYLLHYPCKLLVRDLYVHQDLYFGSEPQVRLEFPSPAGVGRTPIDHPLAHMNQLDRPVTVEHLGRDPHAGAVDGVPGHEPLVRHAFAAAGLDPARFRGYRFRIVYPVPMIGTGWWIRLPEGPGPGSSKS